ncbi:hypothetical protein ACFVJ5_17420 [Nocardia sp. NPDC127606]|uniref:hypothetical protein n=1 Tax=Nocardia sp. NPDC127606 TaxID=3345406 RepID=UPI00363A3858
MEPAWIAVIGTVSGGVVSAGSGAITSFALARQQRASTKLQFAVASRDRRRQELRQVCLDYLSAYSALRDRILVLHRDQQATDSAQPGLPFLLLQDFAPEETTQFKQAEHTLQITASTSIIEAAKATTLHLYSLARAARKLDQPAFNQKNAAGLPLREALEAAMRSELEEEHGVN